MIPAILFPRERLHAFRFILTLNNHRGENETSLKPLKSSYLLKAPSASHQVCEHGGIIGGAYQFFKSAMTFTPEPS